MHLGRIQAQSQPVNRLAAILFHRCEDGRTENKTHPTHMGDIKFVSATVGDEKRSVLYSLPFIRDKNPTFPSVLGSQFSHETPSPSTPAFPPSCIVQLGNASSSPRIGLLRGVGDRSQSTVVCSNPAASYLPSVSLTGSFYSRLLVGILLLVLVLQFQCSFGNGPCESTSEEARRMEMSETDGKSNETLSHQLPGSPSPLGSTF